MSQSKLSLVTNPIRIARESQNKTLQQFADSIGCHFQAVYLNESGIYPTILPKIKIYLTNKLGLNAKELDDSYKEFVLVTRKNFGALYGPFSELPNSLVGTSPIVRWRESLGLTRSALAKGICVQPYQISNTENKVTGVIPTQMLEAFRDIGMEKHIIEELEYRVEEYYYS